MRLWILFLQAIVSFFVTAVTMPFVLVLAPSAQDQRVGLAWMAGILAVTFSAVHLVWPRRKA
jgi:hypothetical protein